MDKLKTIGLAAMILIIIDMVWILLFMGNRFGTMVTNIQGKPMSIKPLGVLLSYIFLCIGVVYFGINHVDKNNPIYSSIMTGGLFGLLAFGIFDFTNYALFSDYKLSTAIIDTIWGGFLCAFTTYVTFRIFS